MTDIDLDAEIREYQWRRKFEFGERRRRRLSVIAPLILLALGVIAGLNIWW